MSSYLKRPNSSFWNYNDLRDFSTLAFINRAVFQAETEIYYSGYIENELERIEKNRVLETKKYPLLLIMKRSLGFLVSLESVFVLFVQKHSVRPQEFLGLGQPT